MKSFERFRIFLVLTAVLSACVLEVSRGVFDLRIVFGLALLYGGSVFLRDRLYSSESTFFDYDHREIARPNEDLVILGNRVRNLSSQSRERTLLLGLTRPGKDRWKILGAALVFSALAVWFHLRVHGLIFWEAAGSVFIICGVLFSAFVVQLLLPVFLALGLVGVALYRDREVMTVISAVFFFGSFLVTLILYREIDADRANPKRATRVYSAVKSGILWGAVFLGLFWIFHKLVPEPSTGSAVTIEKPKLNREIAHQVLNLQERLQKRLQDRYQDRSGKSRPRDGGGSGLRRGLGPGDRSGDGKFEIPEDFGGQKQQRPGGTEELPTSNGPMAKDPVPNGPPLDELPSRKGNPGVADAGDRTKDDIENPRADDARAENPRTDDARADDARPSGDALPADGEKAGSERSGIEKSGIEKSGAEKATAGTERGDPERGGAEDAGPSDGTSVRGGADTSDGAKAGEHTDTGDGSPAMAPAASSADRETKLKELEKKIELPMEITKGVLAIVGIIFVLLMLAKYFSKPSENPEKEIRVQQLSKKQRERLRTILQQIHAKGLSAQDEVIETYNALMAVFQVGEHRREEWLPPEEFSIQIGRSLPSLKKSFDEVTTRFSRTLYGEKPVSESELLTYREGVTRILKFFQVN